MSIYREPKRIDEKGLLLYFKAEGGDMVAGL